MKSINQQYVYFISIVSAMGGLLFGYDWVVIGGAKPFYEVFFGITDAPALQGAAMSIALVGCLLGAMTAGMLADRFGRKLLLLVSAVIFLLSAYFTGCFDDFNLFLAARFLGGIGIGIASGLSPMYIAEVSPRHIRGKLVSLNQLAIVIGILAAQITNLCIAETVTDNAITSWNCLMGWRWMFWAEAAPAIAFLILAFFIPESPRWLALKGNNSDALAILTRIGGDEYAQTEMQSITLAPDCSQSGFRSLFSKPLSKILAVGVVLAVFQQWSGTNVIFNYAQEIFQSAGYSIGDVLFNIVVTGITNVVFTFVAIYTVERLGRRRLMLLGASGLALVYGTLGTCYYLEIKGSFMVLLVVLAIAIYAMTLGPVVWVLIAELFPSRVRAVAVATCTFALWVGSTSLTFTFPLMNKALGSYGTFWIYAAICASCFVYLMRKLPETRGRSLEDIEKIFAERK
ncbi:MAG: sugar porter family MFS transporter [Muribaculaceae bacterium]